MVSIIISIIQDDPIEVWAELGIHTIGSLIPRSCRISALKQLSGCLQKMLYIQLWKKVIQKTWPIALGPEALF